MGASDLPSFPRGQLDEYSPSGTQPLRPERTALLARAVRSHGEVGSTARVVVVARAGDVPVEGSPDLRRLGELPSVTRLAAGVAEGRARLHERDAVCSG